MNATVSSPGTAVGVDMRIVPLRFRLPPGLRDRIIQFLQRQSSLDKVKDKLDSKRVDIEKTDVNTFPKPPAVDGTNQQPGVTVPPMWLRDP